MKPLYPLTFEPILKRAIWGGRRLERLGKPLGPESGYAESWEISDLGSDISIVDSGPLAGVSLRELIQSRGEEILGRSSETFPLLVKLIDARKSLSVQVHPSGALARELGFSSGKTEMWVILEAEPGSVLYMGLEEGVGQAELREAIDSGRVEETLHRVPVTPGDCCFLPAGAVHAIGAGVLLAEIQQPSDATLRLYDWNRVDAEGKPRTLHVEEALRAIDFNLGPINPLSRDNFEHLVNCPYFSVNRKRLHVTATAVGSSDSFTVIVVIQGKVRVEHGDDEIDLTPGRTVLLPASLGRCLIRSMANSAEILTATVPAF